MARLRDSKGRFVSSGGGSSSGGGTNVGGIFATIGADISGLLGGLDEAKSELEEFGKEIKNFGKAMTVGFSAPLAVVSGLLTKVGSDFEKSYNTIRATTGKTGDELQGLENTFKNTLGSMSAPAEQVAEAVSKLNSRLDMTGKPLEDLSKQVVKLARVTKEDLTAQINAETRVFGDWSISTDKQSAALDYLFKVHQKTGIAVTELSELIVQFGSPLRSLGFNMEQAAAMMGRFEKEGVNLQSAMPGFKMALAQFAKDGVSDTAAAFKTLIEHIKNAKTDTEATTLSLQYFGQRAGPDLQRAIQEGRLELDNLVASVKNSSETINKAASDTSTLAGKFGTLTNKISVALEPLGTKLYDTIEKTFASIMPYFEELISWVSGLVDSFLKSDPVIQTFTASFVLIGGAVGPVVVAFGAFVTALDAISAPAIAAGIAITSVLSAITSAYAASPELQKAVSEIINLFTELAKRLVKIGSEILAGLISGINSMLPELTKVLTFIADTIISVLKMVLGIASPSTEAIEIGEFVGEGLSEGLDNSQEGVSSSAKELAQILEKELKSNLDKVEDFGKAIEQALKNSYDKQSEMAEDKANANIRLAEQEYDKKKDFLQDTTDAVIDNLEKQKTAVKDTADANIREIQKEHREKTKALEDETDALVKNLEAQKENSSQKVEEDTNKQKDTEYNQKLTEKKDKLKKGGTLEDLAKTQQEIDNLIADHNLELEKREAKHNEKLFSDQIKAAKEAAKQKKDALDDEQRDAIDKEKEKEKSYTRAIDAEKKAIQEATKDKQKQYSEDLANYKYNEQEKLKATQDNLKALSDNAGFEAQKKLVQGNQTELLNLLQTYYPNWQNAGQSYGEALADGLNSQKENSDAAIANLLDLQNVIPQQKAQLEELTKSSDSLGLSLDTVSKGSSSFSQSVSSITSALEPISGAFKVASEASGKISETVDSAKNSFFNFFTSIGSYIPGLNDLSGWFQNLANQYIPLVQQGINSLTSTTLPVLMQIYNYVVGTMFPEITNAVNVLFYTVMPSVVTWIQSMVTNVTAVLTTVFNFITVEIVPVIMKTFQDMLPALTEIWNNLTIIVGGALATIFNIASQQLGYVKAAFEFVWPFVAEIVKNQVSNIATAVKSMVNFVNDVLKIIAGIMTGDWKKIWEGASDITINVIKGLGTLALLPLTSFASLIVTFLDGLKLKWDGTWDGLQSKVSGVFSGITSIISDAITGINSLIGSLISSVQSAISWLDQLINKKNSLLGGGGGNTSIDQSNTTINIDNSAATTGANIKNIANNFMDSLLQNYGVQ